MIAVLSLEQSALQNVEEHKHKAAYKNCGNLVIRNLLQRPSNYLSVFLLEHIQFFQASKIEAAVTLRFSQTSPQF